MDEIIDKDSLRYKEVCNSFTCSFNLQCEKAISLDENYIVKINGTRYILYLKFNQKHSNM